LKIYKTSSIGRITPAPALGLLPPPLVIKFIFDKIRLAKIYYKSKK